MITVKGLGLTRNGSQLLRDVTFDVPAASVCVIVGPNGAGKSTLLRCLSGYWKGEGIIEVSGQPLASLSSPSRASIVGYVPQSVPASSSQSVKDVLACGNYATRYLSSQQMRSNMQELVSMCSLEYLLHRPFNELSGGERKRVLIATSLVANPKVLLLDEPTAHLDPRVVVELISLLSRIQREKGTTMVIATHDINGLTRMASNILGLKDGSVTFFGPKERFLTTDVLESIYQTEFSVIDDAASSPIAIAKEVLQ